MVPGECGLYPGKGVLASYLSTQPKFHDPGYPEFTTPVSLRLNRRVHYHIDEWDELLDSSNLGIEHWIKMLEQIEEEYDNYDGFVIVHGTDTMAYTASALSFMIENLSKPVVITGSQVPISIDCSDAEVNLSGAIHIAAFYHIPEVCILFHNHLIRGNRSTKFDNKAFDAFKSPNFPYLAALGTGIDISWNYIRPTPSNNEPVIFRKAMCADVGVLKLFPGIGANTIKNFLLPPLKGCVLETYGAGNGPTDRPEFLEVLKNACDRGVIIVNVSQCSKGMVSDSYESGTALTQIGVLGGADMTCEAALSKLSYLLALKFKPERIKALMRLDIRGELTRVRSEVRTNMYDNTFIRAVSKAYKDVLGSVRSDGEMLSLTQSALFPVLMCSAAFNGNYEMIMELISSGQNIDSSDYNGRGAIHLAASKGHIDIVELLLRNGADPHLKDRYGNTPIYEAKMNGFEEIVDMLVLYLDQ
eukprot:TRINITY_DN1511_c0_g1_i1.p1 TRINITY_DN1511_c0_g1~~TRINITY_DN1511_c0_g1_i1.p1  ORF type:complete len:472 (-),score=83.20 TRINITY_DN1511_c0_g1_i1:34-1449(-)